MPMTDEEFQALEEQFLTTPPSWEVESAEDTKTSYVGYIADMAQGVASGVQGAARETLDIVSAGEETEVAAVEEFGSIQDASTWNPIKGLQLAASGLVDGIDKYGIEDPDTLPGQLVDGTVQFLTAFLPLNRAAAGIKAVTTTQKVAKAAGLGAVADAVAFDEGEARLSNLVQSFPMLQNPVTDYLSAKEGDKGFEAKTRQVLEGLVAGPIVDGLISGVKLLKRARADKIEAGEIAAPSTPVIPSDPLKGKTLQPLAIDTPDQIDEAITKLAGKAASPTRATIELDADRLFTDQPIRDVSEQTRLLKTELRFDPKLKTQPPKDPKLLKAFKKESREIDRRVALVRNHLSTQVERSRAFNSNLRKLASATDAEIPALKESIETSLKAMKQSQTAASRMVAGMPGKTTKALKDRLTSINKQAASLQKSLAARMKDVEKVRAQLKPFQELQSRMGVKSLGGGSLRELETVASQMDSMTDVLTKAAGKTTPEGKLELAKGLLTYFHLSDKLTGGGGSTGKRMESLTLQGKGDGSRAEMARLLDVHYDIDLNSLSEVMQLLPDAQAKNSALLHLKKRLSLTEQRIKTRAKGTSRLPQDGALPPTSQAAAPPTAPGRREAKSAADAIQRSIVEAYIMGLFSGIKTQAINVIGNTATFAWAPVERLGASLVPGSNIPIGEVSALVKGQIEGMREGVRLAATTLRTGKESILKSSKIDFDKGQAISAIEWGMAPNTGSGKLVDLMGEVVRTPGRLLLTGDQFFKAVNFRSELHALAYRQASKEGLSGEAFSTRYQQILADPPPLMKEAAEDFAFTNTFTKKLPDGGVASKAVELLNTMPLTRLLLPVIRTPVNIFKYLGVRTPLAPLAQSVRSDLAAGGSRRAEAVSKIALGSSVMAGGMALWGEGFITGGGPSEPSAARVWRMNNQEYSVKIGDQWVKYENIEPIGAFLKLGARGAEIMSMTEEGEEAHDKVLATLALAGTSFLSENWLMSLGDLFEAVNSQRPDKMTRFMENFAKSWTPGIVKDWERTIAPQLTAADGFFEEIAAGIPGLSDDLPGRYNFWGEPMVANPRVGPDFISPLFQHAPDGSPAVDEMVRLGMGVRLPTKTLQGVEITEEERQRLIQIRGELGMKDAANELVVGSSYQSLGDDQREVMIKQLTRRFTEAARKQLLSERPTILQAIANKGALPQIAN